MRSPWPVLNACRRQRSVHSYATACGGCDTIVLNACRRQRSVHWTDTPCPLRSKMCSTPVGVKDRFTRCTDEPRTAVRSAQRLSASKIGSLFTNRRRGHDARVLNACRRQRSVHLKSRCIDSLVAEVLNACRRQRSVHFSTRSTTSPPCETCSTPVGVKDRFTKGVTCPFCGSRKCSTPVGVKDRFTGMERLAHLTQGACSTPVGVKDRFTIVLFFLL